MASKQNLETKVNMNIRSTIFLVLFACFSVVAVAQESPLEFNETTHDFGELDYAAPTEFLFKFKNTTNQPISLTNVKASCGCTTPIWTREAVAPGAEGEIKVRYDSKRIGPFSKSIRVTYDTVPTPLMLYIKGKIKNKPVEVSLPPNNSLNPNAVGTNPNNAAAATAVVATEPVKPKIADKYRIERGALSFVRMGENLGKITSKETSKQATFELVNNTNAPVKLMKYVTDDPEVSVAFSTKVLKAGQEGTVTINIDGTKMEKTGYFSKQIKVVTDEAAPGNEKTLVVNGSFEKIFEKADMGSAPVIKFEETSINGGKIIEGEKFVFDFKFSNVGKGDLIINSAKASCGCTATTPPKDVIKPGEVDAITATFNSRGRMGKQSKSITVKTNDPENPTKVLRFTVEVVKDPFHSPGVGPAAKPAK